MPRYTIELLSVHVVLYRQRARQDVSPWFHDEPPLTLLLQPQGPVPWASSTPLAGRLHCPTDPVSGTFPEARPGVAEIPPVEGADRLVRPAVRHGGRGRKGQTTNPHIPNGRKLDPRLPLS